MPVYTIKMPDGGTLKMEGPAGASDTEIITQAQRIVQQQRPGKRYATPVVEHREGIGNKIADTVRAVANGAVPWADKIAAGADAVVPVDKLLGKDVASIWDGSSLSDAYRHNLGGEQALTKAAQENSPYLSMAGNIVGALRSPFSKVVPGGGLGRGLANAAIYGGATGSGQSEAGDELGGGIMGAVEGVAGQLVGHGLLKGIGRIAAPVVDPVVKRLRDADVPLTIGRLVPWLKSTEDKLAGTLPFAGDVIKAAQRRSIQGGNRAMVNDALSPIDVTIPKSIKPGRQTAKFAQQAASDAYDKSLRAMHSVPDAQLTQDLQTVQAKIAGLPEAQRAHVQTVLAQDVDPFMQGQIMTGDQLQAIKRGLDTRISKLAGSSHPSDEFAADALGDVRAAIMGNAERQNPDLFEQFRNADSAYANVQRLNDAFAKMRSDKEVSPLAFAQSVAKKGYGTTTAKVAAGEARMQQLSDDLSGTLPSSVPDSGSGGRLAQLALGGAAVASPVKTALIGGALSLPYAPGVDRVIESLIAGERPYAVQAAGRGLKKIAPVAGRLAVPSLLYGLGQQQ